MKCEHGELPYRIGDKWSAHVLRGLQDGRRRFTELRGGMPAVTAKVLTETLRAMERNGTVTRTEYDENPPRVEYELTEQGHKLLALLDLCCGLGSREPGGDLMRLEQIVVDSNDPARLVRFWAELLGGEPVEREHGWAHVEPPGGVRMSFQPVPERKDVKNRLHLDFEVEDIEAAVVKAVNLGATREGLVHTDEQGSFQVMRDPEGNEFCFVR